MSKGNIVVVGASAGGVEAITGLVSKLPADYSGSLFVVLHFPQNAISVLPDILCRKGKLKSKAAEDGEAIQPGMVYVATPGKHLLVKKGYVRVIEGPKENSHRPAIDPLFRSASRSYGKQTIGVLLSGMLDDGVLGLSYIKESGGTTLVQDPEEALFQALPRNALSQVDVDCVLSVSEIAEVLVKMASQEDSEPVETGSDEKDPVEEQVEELRDLETLAVPSTYTCPECKGTLFELTNKGVLHYRCRVGHAYNQETLEGEQSEVVEAALWEAVRALEENMSLNKKLLARSRTRGMDVSVRHYEEKIREGQRRVGVLQQLLTGQIEWRARQAAVTVE